MHRTGVYRLLAVLACAAWMSAAAAQSWPTKTVRIVVGFPPGGINDIVARVLAQRLTEPLGQPVIVENRAGAGGTVGADYVAKSAPDGYTYLLGSVSNITMAPSLYEKLPYAPERDFSPVVLAAAAPNILIVNPSFPARSARELIDMARKSPGQIAYASAGTGTSNHLTVELLRSLTAIDVLHVPYKGDAPAIADVVAGQVPFMFATLPVALPYVKSGRVRPLAVSSLRRSALVPEVPTVSESGIANFEVSVWVGLVGPAGVPPDIVRRLNAETNRILAQQAVRDHLAALGVETAGGSPEEFAAVIRGDLAKWARVVREAGIKPN